MLAPIFFFICTRLCVIKFCLCDLDSLSFVSSPLPRRPISQTRGAVPHRQRQFPFYYENRGIREATQGNFLTAAPSRGSGKKGERVFVSPKEYFVSCKMISGMSCFTLENLCPTRVMLEFTNEMLNFT